MVEPQSVLGAGQPCMAQASIAALLPFDISLLRVAIEPEERTGAPPLLRITPPEHLLVI